MTRRISLLFLVLVCLFYPNAAWSQLELTQGVSILAQEIQDHLAVQPKSRLAVVPFRMNGGSANALETFLAEELIANFVRGGKIAVVERGLLSEILKEIRNSGSGLIDQATAKKARLQGADYILTGTITDLPNWVAVNARVIDTETGQVSASAQVKLLRDENVRKLLENLVVETSTPPNQDCRELQKLTDRLQAENLDLRSKVGRLESHLNTAPKELDQDKKKKAPERPTHRPTAVPAAVPTPAVVQEQALHAVEEALGKIEVRTGSSMVGPYMSESGAFQAWKTLYVQFGSQAIQALRSLLANPKLDWQVQWKIITLLTYASHIPEEREQVSEIMAVTADLILRGGYVETAALNLIVSAPSSQRSKWELLFPVLQAASFNEVSYILQYLPGLTPEEERVRTSKYVADLLLYSTQYTSTSAAVAALKAFNARTEIPRFREALSDAPAEKANSLADLLAYFGDQTAVPAIRKDIETWRHGATSLQSLVSSLLKLEGSACYAYLAEILADSHPQVQREILYEVLYKSDDPVLLAAARRLTESTTDPEVKKLAQQYITSHATPAPSPLKE